MFAISQDLSKNLVVLLFVLPTRKKELPLHQLWIIGT